MIRYSLKCADNHSFESWFASLDAFETLKSTKMVLCPTCGSHDVSKAIMAPRVMAARDKSSDPTSKTKVDRPLAAPMSDAEVAVTKMRQDIEKNSDYVGVGFAAEARKMHDGDTPQRSIYGEARLDEAKKLVEDGIPVVPLPFMPQRKTN